MKNDICRLIRMEEPVVYDGVTQSDEFPLFLFFEFEKFVNILK